MSERLALRRYCASCGATHYATQCHICKAPAIAADERAELLEAFATLPNVRRLSFETFLAEPTLLLCLRNLAAARRRARAERAAADPENFELRA